ncbi:hypothetical protein LIER_12782 [Lithospermum erythrorhizon]|uniref:Retrotransposon gag protein n=1 Tax=Lithospermum erythrorhizon TaxID=34254 RepID=A0AAV3PX64_LITER
MWIQGMHWELQYIMQGILPQTIEQLATRAHDMELSIVANKGTKTVGGGLDLGKKERLTLKEMQEKDYPFLESDVPSMFDELLKAKFIELPVSKRLEEANRSTEPNFCKYYRILGHPIEKCFIFKERDNGSRKKGGNIPEKREEEGEPLPEDVINAPPGLEKDVKITIDELKEVNLGTNNELRPTYISSLLTPEE